MISRQLTTTISKRFASGQSLLSNELTLRNIKGEKLTGSDLFKGKKVVVVGIPGAFTPTCSLKHVPSFVEKAGELKQKGINEIYCVAVNDHFVMKAFGENLKTEGKVTLLSDSDGSFTRTLGLEADLGAAGLGKRSKRYALVVNDGKIEQENVEPNPGQADITTAEAVLKKL
eukprot:TRINITY_DN1606_c0_g1_i1.p1 TRINITY_DN1606_c0_g1~~TRINITY_DN1606_c0_g1_i1.p1  ORF type:complete len:172 (+),score=56.47 TRINITY_DN1606_c0_g1_i1:57-572(+)